MPTQTSNRPTQNICLTAFSSFAVVQYRYLWESVRQAKLYTGFASQAALCLLCLGFSLKSCGLKKK